MKTPSYYKELFISSNEKVDDDLKKVYSKQPRSKVYIFYIIYMKRLLYALCIAHCSQF